MSYSYAIEQAIRAAAVLHKDHVRKGQIPFPYCTHLFAVAMIVSDYTEDEATIVASLLHDTLEDTDYTEDELREDFGNTVSEIVLSLTKPPRASNDPDARRQQQKQFLKQLKNASEPALVVLAADKIHNMRSVVEEYYNEHARYVADFGTQTESRLVHHQEISNILNRQLKNAILAEFNSVFTEYKSFISEIEHHINAY